MVAVLATEFTQDELSKAFKKVTKVNTTSDIQNTNTIKLQVLTHLDLD